MHVRLTGVSILVVSVQNWTSHMIAHIRRHRAQAADRLVETYLSVTGAESHTNCDGAPNIIEKCLRTLRRAKAYLWHGSARAGTRDSAQLPRRSAWRRSTRIGPLSYSGGRDVYLDALPLKAYLECAQRFLT